MVPLQVHYYSEMLPTTALILSSSASNFPLLEQKKISPLLKTQGGIYKCNAMQYKLTNMLIEFALQSRSRTIIAANISLTYGGVNTSKCYR